MDKRTYNNIDNSKLKKVKKNPVQEVFSTLPQLAISSAFLLFALYTHESPFLTESSLLFYISLLAGIVVCSVFFMLQLQGVEFRNWEKEATTRKYIHIAAASTVVSFIGFNISLWSIYGILTPFVIIAAFINILSIFTIVLAFVIYRFIT